MFKDKSLIFKMSNSFAMVVLKWNKFLQFIWRNLLKLHGVNISSYENQLLFIWLEVWYAYSEIKLLNLLEKKNVKWETLFQMSNSFAMVVMKMRTNAQSGYFLLLIFTTYAILYTSNNRPWRQKMKSLRLSIAQLRSLQ